MTVQRLVSDDQSELDKSKKLELEIQKLRLEIKNINRPLYVQILNTFIVIILAIMVLVFYQKPQLEQAENAQAVAERQQIGAMLISTQSINDKAQQAEIISFLSDMWPKYPQLKTFAKASESLYLSERSRVLSEKSNAINLSNVGYICTELNNSIKKLDDISKDFRIEFTNEAKTVFKVIGVDIFNAYALRTVQEAAAQLPVLRTRRTELGCS